MSFEVDLTTVVEKASRAIVGDQYDELLPVERAALGNQMLPILVAVVEEVREQLAGQVLAQYDSDVDPRAWLVCRDVAREIWAGQ